METNIPEVITYSLRANQENSDEYFEVISKLCDDVSDYVSEQFDSHLSNYGIWLDTITPDRDFSREEHIFTILNLGILWELYGNRALESKQIVRRILSWLVSNRKKSETFKPMIDLLRGIFSGLIPINKFEKSVPSKATLQKLNVLVEWLKASGEYSEEVVSLQRFQSYLASLPRRTTDTLLEKIKDLATWFSDISLNELGVYTEKVDDFLENEHPHYRWREDNHFTGRKRVEYHLNMLGTEILNRKLKRSFIETSEKIVILPPCMKAKKDDECEARQTPFGEQCMNCTPGCRINQVTRLGEKHGFRVAIIPDELNVFSRNDSEKDANRSIGVLGVACPLTNAQGGLEMIRMGVPAQGLPLDYCGCTYHWHKDGIPTDLNIRQLLHLLNQIKNNP